MYIADNAYDKILDNNLSYDEVDLPLNSNMITEDEFLVRDSKKIKQDVLLWFKTELGRIPIEQYTYGGILEGSLYKLMSSSKLDEIRQKIYLKMTTDFKAYLIVNKLSVYQEKRERGYALIIELEVQDILTSEEVGMTIEG